MCQMNRKQRRTMKARGIKMPERSEDDIRKEYGIKCTHAGELQYRIEQMENELGNLNTEIRILNQEYAKVLENKPKTQPEVPKVVEAAQSEQGEINVESKSQAS